MKTLKVALAVLLIAAMALTFAACAAKPSGKYEGTLGTLEFKGNKISYKLAFVTLEGKFEMDGENVKIVWENDEGDKAGFNALVYDKDEDTVSAGGILVFKKAK